MRSTLTVGLAAAFSIVSALASGVAAAQGERAQPPEDALRAAVNVIVPQQRCYSPRPIDSPIAIKSVDADVRIVEQVATTTLKITLHNPAARPQEAELLVPMPAGASVRSFGVEGMGAEPTAALLPRDEARRVYESIVRRMRDPGLLEFAGYNFVKSSVFPVPAGKDQTLTLAYEHVLTADGDRVDYLLPRSETFGSTSIPWTVHVKVESKRAISTVYSPTHEITTLRDGPGDIAVDVTKEHAREPSPFRLSVLFEHGGVSTTLLAYPDAGTGGGYFLLLAGAPAGVDRAETEPAKREVIIVLDRSGSMRGEKIEQARKAAIQVVDGLADGEAFNIIDYSDTISRFAEAPVLKNDKTLADARAYLSGIRAEGGTNIHDALQEAVRQPNRDELPSSVLFLTDGLPTAGDTNEVNIRNHTRAANTHTRRIFTFGVGYDVNAPLLDRLAQSARGASLNVLPGQSVEGPVSKVFRRLAGPVLSWPKLTALDAEGGTDTAAVRDTEPSTLPDLFEGDRLVVLGRYADRDTLRLRLEGETPDGVATFDHEFELSAATTANAFVPRLWAGRRIASLIDQIRQNGASDTATPGVRPQDDPVNKELVDEIVRLSTRYGILTEYTSFLATDGDGQPGYAIDMEEASKTCAENLRGRAVADRSGQGAVSQSVNIKAQQSQAVQNKMNAFYNAQMERVSTINVCQINDQTLFRRGDRWVDARLTTLGDDKIAEPDETIEFGSDAYFKLADELARDGRQGLLAFDGDIYIDHRGRRVLVTAPKAEPADG